jgi:hypothetical protein
MTWYDTALVRTPGGWRIARRECRITWWTGNPRVNETIPGVKFDLATTVLRGEADAGRVGILAAAAGYRARALALRAIRVASRSA